MMENYWQIIAKSLTGEISQEEEEFLRNWIKQHPDNERTYLEAKQIWSLSKRSNRQFDPDAEEAWQEFVSKMDRLKAAPVIRFINKGSKFWMKFAAAGVLLIGLAYFLKISFFDNNSVAPNRPQWITQTTSDSILNFYLPDSSLIWLNKNSRLSYPKKFTESSRTVELSGEAYFEVRHKSDHPFIATVGEAQVKILGTSFNIKAYEEDENIQVSVMEGKVEFSVNDDAEHEPIELNANEEVIFNKRESKVTKKKSSGGKLKWWLKDIKKEVKKTLRKFEKTLKKKK